MSRYLLPLAKDPNAGASPWQEWSGTAIEGPQHRSIHYADQLAANDIAAWWAATGLDDNAPAESLNSSTKWELIRRQGPPGGRRRGKFATVTYVDWCNHRRLHGTITARPTYTTPVPGPVSR